MLNAFTGIIIGLMVAGAAAGESYNGAGLDPGHRYTGPLPSGIPSSAAMGMDDEGLFHPIRVNKLGEVVLPIEESTGRIALGYNETDNVFNRIRVDGKGRVVCAP